MIKQENVFIKRPWTIAPNTMISDSLSKWSKKIFLPMFLTINLPSILQIGPKVFRIASAEIKREEVSFPTRHLFKSFKYSLNFSLLILKIILSPSSMRDSFCHYLTNWNPPWTNNAFKLNQELEETHQSWWLTARLRPKRTSRSCSSPETLPHLIFYFFSSSSKLIVDYLFYYIEWNIELLNFN